MFKEANYILNVIAPEIYQSDEKETPIYLFFCLFFQGFAFINFHRREDASRAIQGVSGFGYDHLILHVEWAKYVA